jgi:hypothetical protein
MKSVDLGAFVLGCFMSCYLVLFNLIYLKVLCISKCKGKKLFYLNPLIIPSRAFT